ncbi:tRNA-(ms[2]io[6]A)-hydroxylase [Agarivorans sp.]|uniref:tRNA-(ms[2]io[6]A)-hydroxylase n=1 Tax=Agarivorans sp. TaxID=1872412 RepID=UPI003D01AFE7
MPYQSLLSPIHQFLHCETPAAWLAEAQKPENLSLLLIDHANAEWKAAASASKLMLKYAGQDNRLLQQEIKHLLAPYEFIIFRAGKLSLETFCAWFFADGLAKATTEQWALANSAFALTKRCKLEPKLIEQIECEVLAYAPSATQSHSSTSAIVQQKNQQGSVFNQQLLEKMRLLIKEELHHFEQVFAIMAKFSVTYHNVTAGNYAKGLISQVRHFEPEALIDKLIIGAYIEARSCERFAKLAPLLPVEISQFYSSLLRSEARHYQDYLQLAAQLCPAPQMDVRVKEIGKVEAKLISNEEPLFRFHSGVPCLATN